MKNVSNYSLPRVIFPIMLGSIYFCLLFGLFDMNSNMLTHIQSYTILFLSFYSLSVFARKTKSIINQYNLFLLSFFLFSFGQVYLYAFGLSYKELDFMKKFQGELINKYLLFSSIAMLSTNIAAELMFNKENQRNADDTIFINIRSVSIVFGLLFFISTPFYYKILVTQFIASREFGYGEIYDLNNNSLYESLSMWHVPSLFALIFCNKDNRKKYIFLALLLIPVLGYLYIGTRSRPMAILLCLTYLWNSSIKNFSKKMIFVLIGAMILMLVVISTVSYTRSTSLRSFGDMYNIAANVGVSDSIIHAFGEFGSSMQVWIRLQHIIPENVGYGLGFSYIAAVLSCIPSILLGGFSFAKYSNLSVWITNIENANYGLGFSMLGEAYYNFGWFGALFFGLIIGFVFYMLSGNWVSKRMIPYKNIFSTIALYIFATAGRGAMYLAIRYIVYCMIIPILIIFVINAKISKVSTSSVNEKAPRPNC